MLKNIRRRIIDLREKKNWSQTELAQKMGFSKSTMSKIESGSRKISAEELKELAEIFDVTTDYLLGLRDIPFDKHQTNHWDIQTLLESKAKIYYAEEGALSDADKLIIADMIGGYIWKKNQRQHQETKK